MKSRLSLPSLPLCWLWNQLAAFNNNFLPSCSLGLTVSSLQNTQEQVAALRADAAAAETLAMCCAPVKKWVIKRAKALDMDWLTLAGKLDLEEECSDDEDPNLPSCTEKLKASLQRDGFSWQDWSDIRSVADVANGCFHLGKQMSAQDALQQLTQSAQSSHIAH
ncbi:hypothetical protein ABBQ38_001364 [Trebouxia sp. C0009 RCD-2024]